LTVVVGVMSKKWPYITHSNIGLHCESWWFIYG